MKKVAAYCRVSTDHEDQLNSLENQTFFFKEYIEKNTDWHLVGIYSDECVTGTSVKKRVQFNRMIEDAKEGRLDLIVTKEVSRFARNTVDTLSYTRELLQYGVGVYFINDNINTLESDGEFRLSIMASVAQEESRKTSVRVKWGIQRQMEKGFVFSPPMLGYESAKGVLSINEEEAEIVRKIFDLYVNGGMGSQRIAQQLIKENVPPVKRIKNWSPTTVMRILKNEKYVGDLVQQKTVVKDYLTHKSTQNRGEKLVFRDHHEPIITREIWDEAQKIREGRSPAPIAVIPQRHNNPYWCSGKVKCGLCRGSMTTKTKKTAHGTVRIYRCRHTTVRPGETAECGNKTYIDERILLACMQFAVKQIPVDSKSVCGQIMEAMKWDNAQADECGLTQAEERLCKLQQKKKRLLALLTEDVITTVDYREAYLEIEGEIGEIKQKQKAFRPENRVESVSKNRRAWIENLIRTYLEQSDVTKELYAEILEKIVVLGDGHVEIYLRGMDLPMAIQYTRYGRGEQYKVICCTYTNGAIGVHQHLNTSIARVPHQ